MHLPTNSRAIFCWALWIIAASRATALPVELAPATLAGAQQPQVAISEDGAVFIAFGRGAEIYVAVSADSGGHFAAPKSIGTLPKLALGMRRGPRIAASGGALTITAMNDRDLFAFHSEDAGRTWSAPVKINTVPGSAGEGLGNLAAGPAGLLFATWLDLRGHATEIYGALSRDGGKTWGPNELVYHSPDGHTCECCHPSAAFNARGDLAVMWRNAVNGSRDLWTAVRPAGADHFDPPARQGAGTWKLNGCPMDGGAVFPQATGSFASTWQREGKVYLSRGPGDEHRLGEGTQPVALTARGVVHVWWQQGADLMHAAVGTPGAPTVFAKDAKFASAAVSPKDGAVVVAYERTVSQRKTVMADVLP